MEHRFVSVSLAACNSAHISKSTTASGFCATTLTGSPLHTPASLMSEGGNGHASIYFVRVSTSDEKFLNILRALVPALDGRSDSPVSYIKDYILREQADPALIRAEKINYRQLDPLVLALFGAKERTENDWISLLMEADERFEITKSHYGSRGAGLSDVCLTQQW
jgi:hypothetical protein